MLTAEENQRIDDLVDIISKAVLGERERCAKELETAYTECETLSLLHGAARIRALT